MRNCFLSLLLLTRVYGQVFPGSVATDSDLLVAVNNAQSVLRYSVGASDSTLIFPPSATFVSNSVVTVGAEIIKLGTYTASTGTATGCTRGYNSTISAAHNAGAVVTGKIVAAHHNNLKDEIKAIETTLGPNLGNVTGIVSTNSYVFSVTPAQSLTASNITTYTFSTLPNGITTASTGFHYLRIADSTSGNEIVLITGVNVGAKQIVFTPSLSHASGQWTLSTATDGIQEAVNATATAALTIPAGTHQVYAQIYISRGITIRGASEQATTISMNSRTANLFVMSLSGASYWQTSYVMADFTVKPLDVNFTQTAGALFAVTGGPAITARFENINSFGAYDAVKFNVTWGTAYLTNCHFLGMVHTAFYYAASSVGNFWITGCAFDGAYAAGLQGGPLVIIFGTLGGGQMSDTSFGFSTTNMDIEASAAAPVNELIFTNVDFDQASTATANIIINGTGGPSAATSNEIMFVGCRISTPAYGIILTYVDAVTFSDGSITTRGAVGAPVTIQNSKYTTIQGTRIVMSDTGPTRAILINGTTGGETYIKNNKIYSATTNVADVIYNASTSGGNVYVTGNTFTGFDRLLNGSAAAGLTQAQGNSTVSQNIGVASAATLTLPDADTSHIVYVTGVTGVSRMRGEYPYRQVKMVTTGAVTFSTGGAVPGGIAVALTTVANQMVIWTYNPVDSLWYHN